MCAATFQKTYTEARSRRGHQNAWLARFKEASCLRTRSASSLSTKRPTSCKSSDALPTRHNYNRVKTILNTKKAYYKTACLKRSKCRRRKSWWPTWERIPRWALRIRLVRLPQTSTTPKTRIRRLSLLKKEDRCKIWAPTHTSRPSSPWPRKHLSIPHCISDWPT